MNLTLESLLDILDVLHDIKHWVLARQLNFYGVIVQQIIRVLITACLEFRKSLVKLYNNQVGLFIAHLGLEHLHFDRLVF